VEEQKKMKKILVVLLAILVTGGLFAQVTFSGDVKSGLQITQSDKDKDDKDAKVKLFHDDAGHRFALNGKVDFDDDFGIDFGFYAKSGLDAAFDHAKLWGEFLNDQLKLTIGTGTGTAWGTGGKLDKGFDDLKGFKFEVKPAAVSGLDVGFQLRTELDGAAPMTAEQWLKETVIGAKYDVDLFSVSVAFALDSDYAGGNDFDIGKVKAAAAVPPDPTSTNWEKYIGKPAVAESKGDEGKQMRALLGVDIKAVPNLEAKVQAYILGLGDLEVYGVAAIGQNIGYQITPELKVAVGIAERFDLRKYPSGYDGKTLKLEVEPSVSYKLSDLITLNLNIPFATGWNAGDNEINKKMGDWKGDIAYDVGVKPKATFTLNDHASIETWYNLGLSKADADGAEAVTAHTVQVNFGWTF
jgi:hypothetical protein